MVATEISSEPDHGLKYELVPPDGGWGYVICVAVTINFIAMCSFLSCFGIIFNDFFTELGMDTTDVSLLAGINAMSVAIAGLLQALMKVKEATTGSEKTSAEKSRQETQGGFLAGPLLKTMSMRKLALLASTSYNAGVVGTVFVKTQAQLILCQGILQNLGMGLLFNLSCTALNDYFKEKRLVTISVVNTITAAAAIVAPMVVDWSTSMFGFQGTLWMISAVAALTFVGSALMQPVAWHMKKVEIEDNVPEMKVLLEKSTEKEYETIKTPVIKLTDPEKVTDLFAAEKKYFNEKTSQGNVAINFIKSYLDWPLLKEYLLTCACYSVPICMFTDNTYMVFLPQYLYARKWSNDSVAWAFSLVGFGDIATRVVLIFSSSGFKKLGSHLLYIIGVVVGIVTKLALLWVTDYTASLMILTAMGISRCTILVLFPLVVSDSVRPEVFPSAMGISMLFFGMSSIVLGPVVGAIRDATGNYASMFYILISLLGAAATAMTLEVVVKRRKQAKLETNIRTDSKYKNKD